MSDTRIGNDNIKCVENLRNWSFDMEHQLKNDIHIKMFSLTLYFQSYSQNTCSDTGAVKVGLLQ